MGPPWSSTCAPMTGSSRGTQTFDAAGMARDLAGWRFMRLGVPDPVRTAYVAWLSRYRHRRCGSPDVTGLLLKVFEEPAPLMAGRLPRVNRWRSYRCCST